MFWRWIFCCEYLECQFPPKHSTNSLRHSIFMPLLILVLHSAHGFWIFQDLTVKKWKYNFIMINNTAYMLTLDLYDWDLREVMFNLAQSVLVRPTNIFLKRHHHLHGISTVNHLECVTIFQHVSGLSLS